MKINMIDLFQCLEQESSLAQMTLSRSVPIKAGNGTSSQTEPLIRIDYGAHQKSFSN